MDSSYLFNTTEAHTVDINLLIDTARWAAGFQKGLLLSQPLLNSVFNYIEANYKESISLHEVAKAVDRSPAYLTNLVRRETGKTVYSWVIERRMAEARRLLRETSQSVEQIAEAVGYFDKRSFSRRFLERHGAAPQAWRRTHQGRSIPHMQIDPQKASKLIKQRAATLTSEEAQRLQACVQEIIAILYY